MKHLATKMTPRLERTLHEIRASGERGITTMGLIVTANITRPDDAILNLRKLGENIVGEWETGGNGKRYMRYWIGVMT